MDWDNDGDLDLVVSCPDKPYNGTYFFENPGGSKMPVFRKAVRIGKGSSNIQAGPNGSIQGPCEAKWGYTTQSIGD